MNLILILCLILEVRNKYEISKVCVLINDLKEKLKVLRPGRTLLLVNEAYKSNDENGRNGNH